MPSELNLRVGRRLGELRAERGMSLSELARRSGVGKATLSGLESGSRNPTLETLYALTTALHVPLSTVLTDPVRKVRQVPNTQEAQQAHEARKGAGNPLSTPAHTPAHARAVVHGTAHMASEGVSGDAVTAVLIERFEDAAAVTDVFRVHIRAGAVQESAAHLPGTEERLVVLSGTARVGARHAPLTVGPGEQAHWGADTPHVYGAPEGDVEAVLFVRAEGPFP